MISIDRLVLQVSGACQAPATAARAGARALLLGWQRWRPWVNILYHWLRVLYRHTRQGFLIRHFDRKLRRRLKGAPASALWQNGYIHYPKVPHELLHRARQLGGNATLTINDDALPIIAYLVNLVRSDVEGYIGPDARVDDIYVNTIPASSETFRSVSGSWHTDNVGHRLKLFFCIEGYGDVPTRYRPGTHRRPYRPSVRQNARFLGRFDFSRLPDDIRLDYATGDITPFDTNGEHRGGYDELHGKRTVLLIEFADRRKSDRLVGLPVGPGRGFLLSRHLADTHGRELMLDPALFIPESNEVYRYARRM